MPKSDNGSALGIGIVIGLALVLAGAMLQACPQSVFTLAIAGGGILIARRQDIKGAMLYLALLSMLGFGVWAILTVISSILPWFGEKVAYVFVCLVVMKEFQRFLDNEYAEGRVARRLAFAAIGILIATIQTVLIWKA